MKPYMQLLQLSKFQAAYGVIVFAVPSVHVAHSEPRLYQSCLMKVPGNSWIHCMFDFELVFDHCKFRNLLFLPVFSSSNIHSQLIFEEL